MESIYNVCISFVGHTSLLLCRRHVFAQWLTIWVDTTQALKNPKSPQEHPKMPPRIHERTRAPTKSTQHPPPPKELPRKTNRAQECPRAHQNNQQECPRKPKSPTNAQECPRAPTIAQEQPRVAKNPREPPITPIVVALRVCCLWVKALRNHGNRLEKK